MILSHFWSAKEESETESKRFDNFIKTSFFSTFFIGIDYFILNKQNKRFARMAMRNIKTVKGISTSFRNGALFRTSDTITWCIIFLYPRDRWCDSFHPHKCDKLLWCVFVNVCAYKFFLHWFNWIVHEIINVISCFARSLIAFLVAYIRRPQPQSCCNLINILEIFLLFLVVVYVCDLLYHSVLNLLTDEENLLQNDMACLRKDLVLQWFLSLIGDIEMPLFTVLSAFQFWTESLFASFVNILTAD